MSLANLFFTLHYISKSLMFGHRLVHLETEIEGKVNVQRVLILTAWQSEPLIDSTLLWGPYQPLMHVCTYIYVYK